MYLLVWNCYF